MSFFVYILASRRNGTLYIGMTDNLARRVWEHQSGAVPGFTKKYGIKVLVWYELHESRAQSLRIESIALYNLLLEHDLFGKPVSTFPDHALESPLFNANANSRNGIALGKSHLSNDRTEIGAISPPSSCDAEYGLLMPISVHRRASGAQNWIPAYAGMSGQNFNSLTPAQAGVQSGTRCDGKAGSPLSRG